MTLHDDATLVAPGELRADLLELFDTAEVPLHVLAAAPGLMDRSWRGSVELAAGPHGMLYAEALGEHRAALLELFARQIDQLPQTEAWLQVLQRWLGRLTRGECSVRQAQVPLFTRMMSRSDSSLLPMAPMTRQTLAADPPREFVVHLQGEVHQQARAWFTNIWTTLADDITPDVTAAIAESWAGALLAPIDLYHKVVSDYFQTALEGLDAETDDNPMIEVMTSFQRDAYQHAKGILRRYGGVFLADVVGLGKTFIGLSLLRYFQDQAQEHAVVVAPPAVCDAWQELAAEHRVELVTVSHGNLRQLEQHRSREILVIDESHNFRNVGTRRHELLTRWLTGESVDRKVILVSATPQNNRPHDVLHQLQLFPRNYQRLPFAGESLEGFFDEVRRGRADLRSLLQHVLVRRTRRFIKLTYPDATMRVRGSNGAMVEQPIEFPERVPGSLRYSIDEVYEGGLYENIIELLRDMHYAIYELGQYARPEFRDHPVIVNLRRSAGGVRGLMKVLLLKRLESSLHAFLITLRRLEDRLRTTLTRLVSEERVRVRTSLANLEGQADEVELVADAADEIDLLASMFDVESLRRELEHDLESVVLIREHVESQDLAHDAKRLRLESHLEQRPPALHRTIIFTQFADTAEYLHQWLGVRFGRSVWVSGSSGDARSVVRRFAPRANRASDIAPATQIDLLITTDTLSEGVNLQDADTLINYDLHWNPVRLVQRAGRIDRIGSPNEKIHVLSFLPELGLERELGLEMVVRRRMEEIISVFGADQRELPAEDEPDVDGAVAAFTGEALEDAGDDDLDVMSEHLERVMNLRRSDPEQFDRIRSLRPGRRGVSPSRTPGLTALRVGWHWAFCGRGEEGIVRLQDHEALERLWQHAVAGDAAPDLEPLERRTLHVQFEQLVEEAREVFEAEAATLREQRRRPRLVPREQWVLERLERYQEMCLEQRRPLVGRMIAWVRMGQYQTILRRFASGWQREQLSPESIFTEMKRLLRRYALIDEELGEVEVVASMFGAEEMAERLSDPGPGIAEERR